MSRPRRLALGAMVVSLIVPLAPVAHGATLEEIRLRVQMLEEEATAAAEGAQEAKVRLASLNRQLNGIKAAAAKQGESVSELQRSLGTIAVEQYKSGGLSKSLELLFSSDPSLYLSAAGSLDAITRRKALQLRRFEAAQQRLNATTLTVNDKLALVEATQRKLAAQAKLAQSKLAEAQALLAKLTAKERERLAKLAQDQEDADQAASLAEAKGLQGISGRAGVAIAFALKQIGDKYVFGADGLTYWDCSGLTMRAYGAAGVSLPHSSAAQSRMGKKISLKEIKPGDLVFFGKPVSHVGIYLGGNRMVHAPRTGSRVKIAVMDMGRKPLVAARRF